MPLANLLPSPPNRGSPHTLDRIRGRQEWKLVRVLPQADRKLAAAWWAAIILRGLLPAGFAIAMGALVGAVQDGASLTWPLTAVGACFVAL